MKQLSIEEIVAAAVKAATDAAVSGIDEKIKAAVQLGVVIGATSGAEAGAAAAIRAAERERQQYRKELYDKRYHNTKLLLKHYRALNEHYKHAVFDTNSAEVEDPSFSEIMHAMNSTIADDTLYIESIKQSTVRTKIIMAHVNRMLEIYRTMCYDSGKQEDERRWKAVYRTYISAGQANAEEIAADLGINKRTVYKYIDTSVSDLTVLFFGIGGLEI